MSPAILLVDDEPDFLESLVRMLHIEGYNDLTPLTDPREVEPWLARKTFDLALLDVTMPHLDGLTLLALLKERSPQTECVMVTANESIPLVIKAIKRGAYDYLLKPLIPETLLHAIERALEHQRLMESLILRSTGSPIQSLHNPEVFQGIDTGNPQMIRLLREAELHAPSAIPVLLTGETGVGKELLARAIHRAGRRANGPFVAVNMLALSPTLFESEFFGHIKGAFTGADRDHAGYLAQAKKGTLFLDEIGDLSMEIQGKLLRLLQEGEYVPVGSTKTETAAVRFIAATNQDLEKRLQQGHFRKDLYYRLQFAHLHIPPLRERLDDIPILSAKFIAGTEHADRQLSPEALELLLAHDWPGNVRELKAVLESAVNLAETGTIHPRHLRLPIRTSKKEALVSIAPTTTGALEKLADVERRHILAVYEALETNKTHTARILDIGLQTLHRKLKEYGVK